MAAPERPGGAAVSPAPVVPASPPAAPQTDAPPAPAAGSAEPDASTRILNDPLVQKTVELFKAKVIHVEPWPRQQ